ncbi:Phage-related minor tail protein [uncultured Clostridium sp.]|nr:Phage-related minor tail protein [uncultured Clostridium sp.]
MGKIQENLVLTDEFTAAFTRFLTLGESAVGATERINNSINMMGQSSNTIAAAGFNTLDQKITELSGKIQEQGAALQALGDAANSISGKGFDQMTAAIKEGNSALIDTIENQSRLGRETQKTNNQAGKLLSTIKRIAAAAGVTTLVRSFLDFSDTQAQINARLNLMNDGFQTTNELSEMIYQSALRSKAAYSDTADAVGKMGLNAGNAFSSNQELIAFTEQVNKQFKIGGASAQEQSNAMVQLTQAMAAGVLRGQDLNSILAAAPGIARTIEESMGWASGSIKQYAEDGKVTAQVVKNALLDMADQTNQKFESIPMTLSDAMTQAQNIVQHEVKQMAQSWNDFIQTDQGQEILGEAISLLSVMAQVGTDALSGIGSAALFVADNMDMILPILAAVGLGFLLVKAQAVQAALGSAAAARIHMASWAAANWPILLLVALFAGALIAAQQFGIGMQEVGGWVGQVFGMTYAVGYNVFATLWNVIASFAEFFANVFNDPVAAIAHLFSNVLDTILSMVETAAGAIDALTGSHLQGAVSGFRGKLSGWVDDTFGENAIQIKRMANLDIGATAAEWGNYGANLGSKLDNLDLDIGKLAGSFNDLDLSGGNNIDKVAKVGKVGKVDDIKLSDEDLKIYRDLAERRYMNKIELKTLAPEINVSIPESAGGNLTADDVTDYIRKMLIEQMNSQTSVSHG